MYNHINHAELKDYKHPECMGKAHEGDVRALVFVDKYNLLISASSDRSIAIHDDSKVRVALTTVIVLRSESRPSPPPCYALLPLGFCLSVRLAACGLTDSG